MMKIKNRYSFAVWVIMFFIIICPTELIFKTERYYYVVCFALLFAACFRSGFILKEDFSRSIMFYALYSAFTLLWSSYSSALSILLVKVITVAFLFIQLQCDYTVEEYGILKRLLLIQFLFIAFLSFRFGYTAWDGRLWIVNGALQTDGNSISAWLVLPCCCFVDEMMKKESKTVIRVIYAILLILLFYITFWTGSRAGIIAVVTGAVLSLLYAFRDTMRKNISFSIIVLIIGVAFVIIVYRMIPDSVIQRFNYSNVSQLGGRTVVWKKMFDDLGANPIALLFGFGESSTIGNVGVVAHSLYIDVLYNQGLLGLLLIVYFMIRAFFRALKNDPYIAMALIGVAIVSASLSEFASRPVMLIFFFSAMNVERLSKDDHMDMESVINE